MNILLSSAGRRTYMVDYFKEALGKAGKVYASNSLLTYTLLKADGYLITPLIYDEGYIECMLQFCKEKQISAIISLFDIDLPILAQNKRLFADNSITVVVSDKDVIDICNDKWKTFQFLREMGINQSPTYINLDYAEKGLDEGSISFPLFLKPRWGMASIGIYTANTVLELEVLYKKLYGEIFKTYLKYESSADFDACILIQKAIKGQEYGLEILNDLHGEYVTVFAKKKVAMRAGETDIALTVNPSPFEDIAKLISSKLRHIGILDIDCFVTENGEVFVLEMNCRFGGQYPFTHLSGVDVPRQIVAWLDGGNTHPEWLSQRDGVQSCKELTPTTLSEG